MTKKYGLPLIANNRGYYLISSQQEYDEYMANLDSRSAGRMKENYNQEFQGGK